MKKHLLLLFALFFVGVNMNAQETCGFEQAQRELERKNPEMRLRREKAEEQLRIKMQSTAFLQRMARLSQKANYTGEIYEIPVVVHVIENRSGTGHTGTPTDGVQLTDEQIKTWIENTNKMYAATYQSPNNPLKSFFPPGDEVDESAVIPFKLVLAKRDQDCKATTGIIRYDCTLPGYAEHGMKRSGTQGPSEDDIKGIAPQWNESAYYNMYIVTGFDSNFNSYGLMGYAGFPTNSDAGYRTVMKAPVVTNVNSTTLAHEFGHSLGLHHPFKGANPQGGECAANADCTKDNDKVCDTEPCQSLLSVNPVPTNQDINPCTNQNYQGVQYNVMNYGYRLVKFTKEQRERALAMFLANRGSLTTSLAATPIEDGEEEVTAASCQVTGVTLSQNYQSGPIKVVLGTIENISEGYNLNNTQFYVDYASKSCLNSAFSTEIPNDSESTLKVTIQGNSQTIKAWIDYNNNGTFEDAELIASKVSASGGGFGSGTEYSFNFTPPADATFNTNLRMRVAADMKNTLSSCGEYRCGQAEDYLVKIKKQDSPTDVKEVKLEDNLVVYDSNNSQLRLLKFSSVFGKYKIYNMLGRLIEQGNANSNVISLKKQNPTGLYILKFQQNGQDISYKFLR